MFARQTNKCAQPSCTCENCKCKDACSAGSGCCDGCAQAVHDRKQGKMHTCKCGCGCQPGSGCLAASTKETHTCEEGVCHPEGVCLHQDSLASRSLLHKLISTSAEQLKPRGHSEQSFCKIPTSDRLLVRAEKVVCVDIRERVPKVFRKLISENFFCAPVLGDGNTYTGMVDLLDLLRAAITEFADVDPENKLQANWLELWLRRASWQSMTVWDLMTESPLWSERDCHRFSPAMPAEFSLLGCIESLVATKAERMPVLSRGIGIAGLITESMLVNLLAEDEDFAKCAAEIKIEHLIDLGLVSPVTTVNGKKTRALEAFKSMLAQNVHALAVLNENGELSDALTVRDLRVIGPGGEQFGYLFESVFTFKKHCRREFPMCPATAVFATPESSFLSCVKKMAESKVHRIFICEAESAARDEHRPIFSFNQRNVLQGLLYLLGVGTHKGESVKQVPITATGKAARVAPATPAIRAQQTERQPAPESLGPRMARRRFFPVQ